MVIRVLGVVAMARLIQTDQDGGLDSLWLLHGPTDPAAVEDETEAPPFLMAAE
jgi:hypothetical protein